MYMYYVYAVGFMINIYIIAAIVANSDSGANFSFVNPKVIYNNIKVNWFGAWVLAIIFNVLFPMIAIPYWIYKLCTAGRS